MRKLLFLTFLLSLLLFKLSKNKCFYKFDMDCIKYVLEPYAIILPVAQLTQYILFQEKERVTCHSHNLNSVTDGIVCSTVCTIPALIKFLDDGGVCLLICRGRYIVGYQI